MNHLSGQTSPYLLQHLDNPVDWYPYGEEAFKLAKSQDKPILLSVGYSACHWCHVMAHESFEDETTAKVMNQHFVNVKVDREERPDVDDIYMQAVTSLTGHGGWPMTVFLTPDGQPFYAGTYFPKERKSGMPAFLEVLDAITKSWEEERPQIMERAGQITTALSSAQNLHFSAGDQSSSQTGLESNGAVLKSESGTLDELESTKSDRIFQLQNAISQLRIAADPAWGGFGRAPKFPQPMTMEFLLNYSGDDDIATIAKTGLDAMASGGIYDHLGGGFARYSTDLFWLVPHFEKMLYDNALLIRLYLHGYQQTKKPRYGQVANECIEYVLRDLSPDPSTNYYGGFYSAEDADSEGEEGLFYVWSHDEFVKALSDDKESSGGNEAVNTQAEVGEQPTLVALGESWFGVSPDGNFEGKNILYRRLRGDLIRPPEVERARQILFEERKKRIRPGLDNKVLTEWNGLMISALTEAGLILKRPELLTRARKASEFLYENLRRSDGRWLRSWISNSSENKSGNASNGQQPEQHAPQQGEALHLACCADYAQVVDAFTRVYSVTGDPIWLERAEESADQMLEIFFDSEGEGGFFSTGKDAEDVIFRPKDVSDNAMPSANSAAVIALLRLSALTGNEVYSQHANRVLDLCAAVAYSHPLSFGNLLCALFMREIGFVQIVIPGTPNYSDEAPGDGGDGGSVVSYLDELAKYHLPHVVLATGQPTDSPIWEGKEVGKAYICRNFTCLEPADSVETFARQLVQLTEELKDFALGGKSGY